MLIHIFAITVVILLFCLIRYMSNIQNFLENTWDKIVHWREGRKDKKKHKGMYDYYHED